MSTTNPQTPKPVAPVQKPGAGQPGTKGQPTQQPRPTGQPNEQPRK